jgi:hypothetical protein
MRRTQVQFDEPTYQALKREAHERGVSMSALLRQLVRDHLGPKRGPKLRIEDFTFIASGNSGQRPSDPLYPISEHHDEVFVESILD